ncbi:protein disulfide-isomerase A4-like [Uloborus diversus]|uniref:protein disulfide-isomerase A4-like n=1 Tax=Uloborus diversus TaxID=327109 RepID=UPI00240A83BA|nr:protein disulfide-isomerase A4-like [Uloborus diversus]
MICSLSYESSCFKMSNTTLISLILFSIIYLTLHPVLCTDAEKAAEIQVDGGTIETKTLVEDDVLILNRDNFDLHISSKAIILVEFYAPWCGHCKSLAPEYAQAATILKNEDPPVPLAKVDATIETDLAQKYEVSGFPTLFIFKEGRKILYDGPRTAMGIVEYMKERSDPNWKPPPEAVLTLTSENFSSIVENEKLILVEFYAPWCGHCKQLAPEYERAAKVLKTLPTPIPLAKVDGTAEKDLAEKYDARGWPTLIIFREGKKYEYNGPRDESGIISYMKEQAKPPSEEIRSVKLLENAIGKNDVVIVGFFLSDLEQIYTSYLETANTFRGKFTFYHVFEKKILNHFGVKKSKIVLYQPEIFASEYQPTKFELTNTAAGSHDVTRFINEHHLPLVGERSRKNIWKYGDKYPLVVVYYDVDFSFDHRVQTQLIQKEVAKVAKDYTGEITFAVSNEEEFEDELVQLNLDDSGEDVNVGYFESRKIKYRMEPEEDFSADVLKNFVQDVLNGDVPRHIRSQLIPKQNKGPVITVVGSTFEELVMKNKKDVLLEFYAPWCGHCKQLEPIYKNLGKKFRDNDKVVIAKIDATANDYPTNFDVNGFPTLYYVPASSKKPMQYDGQRTLEDLTKFVSEQVSKDSSKDEL